MDEQTRNYLRTTLSSGDTDKGLKGYLDSIGASYTGEIPFFHIFMLCSPEFKQYTIAVLNVPSDLPEGFNYISIPEYYESEDVKYRISALLINRTWAFDRSIMITIPDNVSVVVVRDCADSLYFQLENDSHPVFSCPSPFVLEERTEEGLRLTFGNEIGINNGHEPALDLSRYYAIDSILKGDGDLVIHENIKEISDHAFMNLECLGRNNINQIDIQGQDTYFSKNVFSNIKVKEVHINKTRKYEPDIEEKFMFPRDKWPCFLFRSPDPDMSLSENPGYFRATESGHDETIEVNAADISYFEPCYLNRYEGKVTGTRIYFNCHQEWIYVDVYESPEIVSKKIGEALKSLSESIGCIDNLVDRMIEKLKSNS